MNNENEKLLRFLHKLVEKQADQYVENLIRKVIRGLRVIKITTTGDDTVLANCWDEICVQQQDERFYSWDYFEMTIEGVVEGCFDSLSLFEQQCINFAMVQSPYEEPHDYEAIYTEGVVEFIQQKVLQETTDYTNSRIRAYLDARYNFE